MEQLLCGGQGSCQLELAKERTPELATKGQPGEGGARCSREDARKPSQGGRTQSLREEDVAMWSGEEGRETTGGQEPQVRSASG